MDDQQDWLEAQMTASTTPWQVVYMHHSPYSSGESHGSISDMQWDYAAWGADAVLSGHDHIYERIERDGIVYFVTGLGGRSLHDLDPPIADSKEQYNDDYGTLIVDATDTTMDFQFVSISDGVIDSFTLTTAPPPNGDPEELAIVDVTASSFDNDGTIHPPEDSIDNDFGTRWSAEGDGEWIRYDLSESVTVSFVDIAWYKGDQRNAFFDIEVSDDGIAWTQVFTGQSSGTTTNLERYDFADAAATFVRIVGHGNSTSGNDWNSILEVDIYGIPDAPPPPPPNGDPEELAIVSVTASSFDNEGGVHPPEDSIDNDFGTRWSAEGDGEWIRYDLGESVTVSFVDIAWYKGDQRVSFFDIEVSDNGSTWTQVFTGQSSGTTTSLERHDFADIAATFVRIVGHGNSTPGNDWNSILEVDIYGIDGTPPPPPPPNEGELWNSDVAFSVDVNELDTETPNPNDPTNVHMPSHAGNDGSNNHQVEGGLKRLSGDRVRDYFNLDEVVGVGNLVNSEIEFFAIRENIGNISLKFGNHNSDGWTLSDQWIFGGYGVSFHDGEIQSKAEYYHGPGNNNGPEDDFPLQTSIPDGDLIGYKVSKQNDPATGEVVLNAWIDYSGTGNNWTHVMVNRRFTDGDWDVDPSDVPDGAQDSEEVKDGVYLGPCHRWWIRVNDGGFIDYNKVIIREIGDF